MNNILFIGVGEIGEEAKGILAIYECLNRSSFENKYVGVKFGVPLTIVICADVFSQFIDENNLDRIIVDETSENLINRFINSEFRKGFLAELRRYIIDIKSPLIVQPSSILENSSTQSLFSHYPMRLLPNNHPDIEVRLRQIINAIKLMYAFLVLNRRKISANAKCFRAQDIRMAVIIQGLVAKQYEKYCYPSFSGIVQSHNHYPSNRMRREDGLAHVVLGLRHALRDGGGVIHFSPARPMAPPGFSSTEDILRNSQRSFYALDVSNPSYDVDLVDEPRLVKLGLADAEKHGTLASVGSVYVHENGVCRDGICNQGPRLITFTHILKTGLFPLAPILTDLLSLGKDHFGCDIELEFACNLSPFRSEELHEFTVLQCRKMKSKCRTKELIQSGVKTEHLLCRSQRSLGDGIFDNIRDVVFVSPDRWNSSDSIEIARQIREINSSLKKGKLPYLLIGIGRWGTSDPEQGIPVEWDDISMASVIAEIIWYGHNVVPSKGSHIFHELISNHVGYLTIDPTSTNETMDWRALELAQIKADLSRVRYVRFEKPLKIVIDGQNGEGVVLIDKR